MLSGFRKMMQTPDESVDVRFLSPHLLVKDFVL